MADIVVTGVPNPRTGLGLGSGVEGEGSQLLEFGHYIAAPMPLYVNFPRPDSETQAHARHRNFHSDFRYEIPIEIEGGSWPFNFEILLAPAGATVENMIGSVDKGVLKWTPSGQTGTVKFSVLVIDQDGNKITVTWTSIRNNGQFLFMSAAAAISGVGTISSPLKMFADYYISDADATYNNKILVWRAGTYTALGSSGNVQIGRTTKSPSWIGYPDEVAEFDCSGAIFLTDQSNLEDIFVYNLTFKNARQDVTNSRFWYLRSDILNRVTFAKNVFKDMVTGGTAGTDNAACIWVSSTVNLKRHISVSRNIFDNINSYGGNGSYCDFYHTEHALVQQNIAKNSKTTYGFWGKQARDYLTIRANDAWENNEGGQICAGGGVNAPLNNVEISYNNCVIPEVPLPRPTSPDHVLLIFMNPEPAGGFQNVNVFRNTFIGGRSIVGNSVATNINMNANIFVTDNVVLDIDDVGWNDSISSNIFTEDATDLVSETTGELIGSGLQYLYTNGHKVG